MTRTRIALALATALLPLAAQADDAAQCGAVRLFDPGWTDINATNAVATTLLSALGYTPEVKTLSVIVGYEAMKAGEIDALLAFLDRLDIVGRSKAAGAEKLEEIVQAPLAILRRFTLWRQGKAADRS